MLFKALTVAAAVSGAVAQSARPNTTSICDYYTTLLLKNNTAANQKTLLTLVVNTAVIGNYTQPNVGIAVPGILANGTFNGTEVSLAPYFSGALASTNRGGDHGVAVNFLDGGGAAPLMKNMPAEDDTSNQYILLTHLYEYFGGLLGCSMGGTADYPAYDGDNSQYDVHKFMDLSAAEVGYFISQVAASAQSFGVAAEDLMVVGTALNSLFGVSCAPETVVIPSQPAALQSICIGEGCPQSANATCASYEAATEPVAANSTNTVAGNTTSSGTPVSSGTPSQTSGAPSHTSGTTTASPTNTGAASTVGFSAAVLAAGLFAALL